MDVSHLLTREPLARGAALPTSTSTPPQTHIHQYPTRHAMASQHGQPDLPNGLSTPPVHQPGVQSAASTPHDRSPPAGAGPKLVAFELLFPEAPDYRARLPMRVQIYPHDTTDSIITTVKNFYGLYEGPGGTKGVSFEDPQGNTLIARHENFQDGMIVYVRVVLEPTSAYGSTPYASASPPQFHPGHHHDGPSRSPDPPPAQALTYGQPPSRPTSRTTAKGSLSPHLGRGRRSVSAATNNGPSKQSGSRSGRKSRGSSAHEVGPERNGEVMNGFSDSDGGHASVSSSRKAKSEQLASAEISLDNIVEGGRRKRAKFESSELPLFVPPQVPMSALSASGSPAGPLNRPNGTPVFTHPNQRVFAYPMPPQSPQAYSPGAVGYGPGFPLGSNRSMPGAPQHGHHLRNRAAVPFPASRHATGVVRPGGHPTGILPTPDPTIASCISDEDVAIQLMRLGDASNISHGTRHSASTLDDGLSGAADVASSAGATSDHESDGTERPSLPREPRQELESSPIPLPGSIKRRHKHLDEILPSFDSTEPSGDEGAHKRCNGHDVNDGPDHHGPAGQPSRQEPHGPSREQFLEEPESVVSPKAERQPSSSLGAGKNRSGHSSVKSGRVTKSRPASVIKPKPKTPTASVAKAPMSPASLPPHSRKPSTSSTLNFHHTLREDEEDLSSKPRCQRCRKSKKGCDRQRPCQRCKDAGIGAEGCISEDETNGRKGRFGRHMGVTVKKGTVLPLEGASGEAVPATLTTVDGAGATEKSKKRKR